MLSFYRKLRFRTKPEHEEPLATASARPEQFRVPTALRVSPSGLDTILVVGSCLVGGLIGEFQKYGAVDGDFFLFNNVGELPVSPRRPIEAYDLQIVQIPLRSILPDGLFGRVRYDRIEDFDAAFADTERTLALFLQTAMRWNVESKIATLVVNFFKPQQDPFGRLLPRNDLRSFPNFIERLNASLSAMVAGYSNAYILDVDAIAGTMGRRYVQDEVLWQLNHNSTLSDFDNPLDQGRLHPPRPVSERFENRTPAFFEALHAEVEAMHRTLRGIDAVKLVIVDLDDTLWRGVAAEEEGFDGYRVEGWPLGLVEALSVLKARGIVLAIASRNDPEVIRSLWPGIVGSRLTLDDFAVVRMGWRPKSETVAEIIAQVNVLASSTVFIDDNPAERFAAEQACPGLRTLGADLYDIRRVLLWSAETQVPHVTDESGRRTEMVQAQVKREATRTALSREDFLASLDVRITTLAIGEAGHPRFARALELINKTNQFNTTGERWTASEMEAALAGGARIVAFLVADAFTDYGLVGAAVVERAQIRQVVMSCRVIGLDVESAIIREALGDVAKAGHAEATARFRDTGRNDPCASLFRDHGFVEKDGLWRRTLSVTAAS